MFRNLQTQNSVKLMVVRNQLKEARESQRLNVLSANKNSVLSARSPGTKGNASQKT